MCIISVFFFQMFSQNVSPKEGRHIAFVTFQHHAFSNVSSNDLSVKMHSHIGCIWKAFLRCAFSNVSSYCLQGKTHNHIGCICLTFLQCAFQMSPQIASIRRGIITLVAFVWLFFRCVFLNVASKRLHKMMQSHIVCISFTFLHCRFSSVSSDCLSEQVQSHIAQCVEQWKLRR